MEFLNRDIGDEYRRWEALAGGDDPYHSPATIGLHDVLRAHFLIADYFAEKKQQLGGVGPRSLDLLHSALSRQFTSYEGRSKWTDPYEICATMLFGLVMNHSFHDANKRTALLSALFLLHRNGKVVTLPQKRLDGLVVAIADHSLSQYFDKDARYANKIGFSGSADSDGHVRLIAEFLKRNTRAKDEKSRTVTYFELSKALARHGFALSHPNANFINIVRVEEAKKPNFLGLGARPRREVFLAQIGFPGWKDQVNKAALKTVRNATGLNSRNGCDMKVFFEDAEPLSSLISEYAIPLTRLANK